MGIDSAWIFRICLTIAAMLILFADTLGYGGASARSDNSIDNAKFIDDSRKSHKGISPFEILHFTSRYATPNVSACRTKTSFLHEKLVKLLDRTVL